MSYLDTIRDTLSGRKTAMSAKGGPPPAGSALGVEPAQVDVQGDPEAMANMVGDAVKAATNPQQPGYEKENTVREKEKRTNKVKTRTKEAFDEGTQAILDSRWLQEPTSRLQVESLGALREKIDNFIQNPLNADTSALLQFGDLMTRGQFNLAERFKPTMTAAERGKLINDMEKIFQDSVYDVQKAKNQWMQTQTEGFSEKENSIITESMEETGQTWRDTSDIVKGKKLTSQQFDKISGFDEAYNMLRRLEGAYKKVYQSGRTPSWEDINTYEQQRMLTAQKIGKSLEGKMTDEDFKRIKNMLPGPRQKFLGMGDANAFFQNFYDLLDDQRRDYTQSLNDFGYYVPKKRDENGRIIGVDKNLPIYGGEGGNYLYNQSPDYGGGRPSNSRGGNKRGNTTRPTTAKGWLNQ